MRALILGAALIFVGASQTRLLTGTAALVDKSFLTVQDAYFYKALQLFLEGASDPLADEKIDGLKSVVNKMIFEEMVYLEMTNLNIEKISRAETLKGLRALQNSKSQLWKRLLDKYGRTEAEAHETVYKSVQVEKFLQKKVETLSPIVTDFELEKYVKQNEARFRGEDLQTLKPSLTLLLRKEKVEKGLEEWIRLLKGKYGVQNFLEEKNP